MKPTQNSSHSYFLWEGQKKPYYRENSLKEYEKESWGTHCVFNVTEPTLTVYLAKVINSGIGVIVIPGGAYEAEGIYLEGHDPARVFTEQGITAAVLKYRLPNPESSDRPELVPLADTRHALKVMRRLSGEYKIDERKIGLVGFSAGAHLAAVTSLWQSDDVHEKPDFCGYIYGLYSLSKLNQERLEKSLYHRKMTKEDETKNRLLDLVDEKTPPSFLVHACDDPLVDVNETICFARRMIECHVPTEMHIFPKGGHGFGIGKKEDGTDRWVSLFVNWMKKFL